MMFRYFIRNTTRSHGYKMSTVIPIPLGKALMHHQPSIRKVNHLTLPQPPLYQTTTLFLLTPDHAQGHIPV